MDLNYLYQRRGIAIYMARHAACSNAREAHGAFARAYSARIVQAKREHLDNAA